MAELDPRQTQPMDASETAVVEETPVVVEETLVLPANRPRKVYGGMWGPVEIGVVSAGALALMMAFVAYFFWVLPSARELARNKSEADRLEAEVVSARSKYGEISDTQTQVGKLVESLDDFETRFLPMQTNGQAALYQRLNGLIRAYDLVNTTGPDYLPLEAANNNAAQQSEEEKGRAKYRSLYPGVYVTMTLEGSYQNLRRFIREIETGRDFVVVSSVELAPSDTEGQSNTERPNNPAAAPGQATVRPGSVASSGKAFMQPPAGQNPIAPTDQQGQQYAGPKGKTHGETMSLHLEMAAYFRRAGFVPTSETVTTQ